MSWKVSKGISFGEVRERQIGEMLAGARRIGLEGSVAPSFTVPVLIKDWSPSS